MGLLVGPQRPEGFHNLSTHLPNPMINVQKGSLMSTQIAPSSTDAADRLSAFLSGDDTYNEYRMAAMMSKDTQPSAKSLLRRRELARAKDQKPGRHRDDSGLIRRMLNREH